MDEWTQEDIDDEMFCDEDPDDCDCVYADIDLLEGRGHCPCCGRTWYLSTAELLSELGRDAEYQQALADEMERLAQTDISLR